jgi:hypothetical protein
MLADGLIKHHEKSCLRSSSAQSYLFISFWLDNGSLLTLIRKLRLVPMLNNGSVLALNISGILFFSPPRKKRRNPSPIAYIAKAQRADAPTKALSKNAILPTHL